jgi:Methyltransferase FkbM domain
MIVAAVKAVTKHVLPGGKAFRRLPFGPIAGCTMKLNFHYDLRLYLGLYEIETQKWFPRLIRPGYRSFDVGGAGGYDALLLSKLSNGGRVVSFECEDNLIEEMQETFRRNSYPIEAVKAFVSDQDGDGFMSLDSAAQRFFVPDFIKIDIEGAEDKALVAAKSLITERKPNMIVEVHGKDIEERCIATLKTYEYNLVIDQNVHFGENRPLTHNRWLICEGRDGQR